jgi:ribosomal protein S18 acetylase RimI-like enzyme
MPHERAITIRQLAEHELRLAQGIDVSEDGQLLYRYRNGELTTEPRAWHRPAWDAAQWEDKLTTWAQVLRWDVVIGAFDGATLVGLASLRYRLTETMAQLVSLHVSRAYRRHGVATRLLDEVVRLARQSGARELYVSATESESAIGFYTRHGFAPTAHVNQRLYDLEPEDIHMTLPL